MTFIVHKEATLISTADSGEKLFFAVSTVIPLAGFFGLALFFTGRQGAFVVLFSSWRYCVAIGLWRQNTPLTVAGVVFLAAPFVHVSGNPEKYHYAGDIGMRKEGYNHANLR